MYCTNCGKEIPEGAKFCIRCGNRVGAEPAPVNAPAAQEPVKPAAEPVPAAAPESASASAAASLKKKIKLPDIRKLSKKTLIISGVVALAAVLLVIFNMGALANYVKKTVMSPEDYYRSVETKAFAEVVSAVGSAYEDYLNVGLAEEMKSSVTFGVSIGEEIRSYLEAYTGEDFSWLDTVRVEGYSQKWGEDKAAVSMDLMLDGGAQTEKETVVTADMYVDMNRGKLYFRVPELSDEYAEVNLADEYYDYEDVKAGLGMFASVLKECPDRAAVEEIANRYINAVFEGVGDVEKDSGKLSAGGVSAKYTTLEVTIDTKTAKNVAINVLEEFIKDKQIEDIIIETVPVMNPYMDGHEAYEMLIEEAKDALEEVKETEIDREDNEEFCKMTVYVDSKGEIRGRKVLADGGELVLAMPEDGKEFGFELSYSDVYTDFAVKGSGERDGDLYSGEFAVSYDGMEYVEVEVVDFDSKALEDGRIWGKFIVSLTRDGVEAAEYMVSGEIVEILEDYNLVIDLFMSEDNSTHFDTRITSNNGHESLCGVFGAVSYTTGDAGEKPDGVNNAVDAEDWIYEVDFEGFGEHMARILPDWIVEELMYELSWYY